MYVRSGKSSPSREPSARVIRAIVNGAVEEVTVWYMEVARVEIRVPVCNYFVQLDELDRFELVLGLRRIES